MAEVPEVPDFWNDEEPKLRGGLRIAAYITAAGIVGFFIAVALVFALIYGGTP